MLSEKEINEARDHLESAQNPIFLYDNDLDGLCSYIILRRFIGRGKGVAIRTHPNIDTGYIRKIQEFNSDYVFVLDKPSIGKSFADEVSSLGIPLVWIDHHDLDERYEGVFSYNPAKSKDKSMQPTTYLSYKITGERKEDMWIAVIGCISDNFMPEFYKEFEKEYPEFSKKGIKSAFDAYYGTEIGFLAKALSFGLKDSITHVVQLQNFLISCKSPDELISLMDGNNPFGKKYREIRKKYDYLVSKAKNSISKKMLFFKYGGDLSISSEISNELMHNFPGKLIVIAYDNGGMANISLRGDNVRELLEKILPGFEGSSGGGHKEAVGARIKSQDLDRFKKEIERIINNGRSKN